VTAARHSSTGWRVSLAAGAYRLVKIRVQVLRSAAIGSSKTTTVRGTWTGDGSREDLVRAVVRVIH